MESKHGLSALNLPLKPGFSTELRPPPAGSRGTAAGPGASEGADKPSATPPDDRVHRQLAARSEPQDGTPVPSGAAGERIVQRVGVLLVHGIGEQRRFEHL